MKWEDEFDDVLRDVGRQHRATMPPERLESALLARMQEQKDIAGRSEWVIPRQAWVWGVAAALIGLLAWGGIEWRQRWQHHPQVVVTERHQVPDRAQTPDTHATVERTTQPLHRRSVQRRKAHQIAVVNEAGSLDVFVPLPVSEGLPQATQLSLVRVRLTGSDLRQYGLDTTPEAAARSLLAEFVVGEDGLPRAIRIVQ